MNKFNGHQAQRIAAAVATAAVLAAGLLTTTASMAGGAFDSRMSTAIAHVKADPSYKVIPLDSSVDRQWFFSQSEALFKKKITKEQYVADGEKQFPGYGASFSELADELTKS